MRDHRWPDTVDGMITAPVSNHLSQLPAVVWYFYETSWTDTVGLFEMIGMSRGFVFSGKRTHASV